MAKQIFMILFVLGTVGEFLWFSFGQSLPVVPVKGVSTSKVTSNLPATTPAKLGISDMLEMMIQGNLWLSRLGQSAPLKGAIVLKDMEFLAHSASQPSSQFAKGPIVEVRYIIREGKIKIVSIKACTESQKITTNTPKTLGEFVTAIEGMGKVIYQQQPEEPTANDANWLCNILHKPIYEIIRPNADISSLSIEVYEKLIHVQIPRDRGILVPPEVLVSSEPGTSSRPASSPMNLPQIGNLPISYEDNWMSLYEYLLRKKYREMAIESYNLTLELPGGFDCELNHARFTTANGELKEILMVFPDEDPKVVASLLKFCSGEQPPSSTGHRKVIVGTTTLELKWGPGSSLGGSDKGMTVRICRPGGQPDQSGLERVPPQTP